MRSGTLFLGLALAASIVDLIGLGSASANPGAVMSHQKVSNTSGSFAATLDDVDELGGAVAGLGDLDGAGPSVAALAVGAVGDDDGGGNRGATYILFLDGAGSVLSHQKISNTSGNFSATLDNLDDFGSSVTSLGDLDGAGASVLALAVGATGDDDGGSARGAVYILFLNSAGSVLSFQKISDTVGNFTAILDNGDEFGGAVVGLGDLDGAGPSVAALAVGVVGDDDGGTNRGAVYILLLNSAGSVISHTKISSTNFTGLDSADEFGSSVAYLGDLDGPGPSVAALAVGAIGDDDGGADRGAVYILYLSGSGTVLSHAKISSTQGGFTGTLDNLDEFGGAVAGLGDVDGFGPSVAALAVGAIGDDDGGSGYGATYVLFLSSAGSVLSQQKISALSGNFGGALDPGDEFGGALAAVGDLDGSAESVQTLAVGASFDDDGGTDRGSVWELYLQGSRLSDTLDPLPQAPRFALGLARPNPFNPRTTIPFRIATPGWVEIDIRDVHGKLVRKLVLGSMQPGDHEAVLDGLDASGRALPSGSYFYRMTVNGRAVTTSEKAVLLK